MNIETLAGRREKLILAFGKKCLFLEQTKDLFPLSNKEHTMEIRNTDKYKVIHINRERLRNSTVPYIQKVLNAIQEKRN